MRAGDALALPRRVAATGQMLRPGADFDDAFFQVMGNLVEPAIGQQRIAVVSQWPAQMAVLARLDDDDRFACRFEAYAQGLELAREKAPGRLTRRATRANNCSLENGLVRKSLAPSPMAVATSFG